MEVNLTEREVKHLLHALQDANCAYVRYGTRDFTWEDNHKSVEKKLKELIDGTSSSATDS